ncbi:hypothetical protein Tco_0102984 [Tanacetum coccineum]|uniref:Reverse transcriptase domain-containing protein n=1 Tax=Tanacetum coccineum TaxID=301880 RepID=A0ABQ5HB57_9ASTR
MFNLSQRKSKDNGSGHIILDRKELKPQLPPPVKRGFEQFAVNLWGSNFNLKIIMVIDLDWSQIKFDHSWFPPIQIPIANIGNRTAPQTHGVQKQILKDHVTANVAVLRNMQNQGQNLQSQMANLTDMLSKFVTANTASTSGSGTLPGNTITNPKEDLKGYQDRSGLPSKDRIAVNHARRRCQRTRCAHLLITEAPETFQLVVHNFMNHHPPPNQEQYLPGVWKETQTLDEDKLVESSVDVTYRDFKRWRKRILLKVLKYHKRAIAWKLSDYKGCNPEFCTHKILMERDTKPSVQSQRRVRSNDVDGNLLRYADKMMESGIEVIVLKLKFDESYSSSSPDYCEGLSSLFPGARLKLTEVPILLLPTGLAHLELMCDASDFAIGQQKSSAARSSFRLENLHQDDVRDMEINEDFLSKQVLVSIALNR